MWCNVTPQENMQRNDKNATRAEKQHRKKAKDAVRNRTQEDNHGVANKVNQQWTIFPFILFYSIHVSSQITKRWFFWLHCQRQYFLNFIQTPNYLFFISKKAEQWE